MRLQEMIAQGVIDLCYWFGIALGLLVSALALCILAKLIFVLLDTLLWMIGTYVKRKYFEDDETQG